MGDPGTKAALTLTMLVAEEAAYRDYLERHGISPKMKFSWRTFVNSGDDHLATGPQDYLEDIGHHLTTLGAVLNLDMCYMSKLGAFYTEELVVKVPGTRFDRGGTRLDKFYPNSVHVDGVKVRLLSRSTKVTLVRDEKNVALGKLRDLANKLHWLPVEFNKSFVDLTLARAESRFTSLVDWNSPLTYWGAQYGGLGLPTPSWLSHDDLHTGWLNLPAAVRDAHVLVSRGEASTHVKHALRLYASNTTYRGITMRTIAEDQLRFIFQHLVSDSVDGMASLKLLAVENGWVGSVEEYDLKNHRSKLNLASSHGYICLSEAIQMFERPTAFKECISGLQSIMEQDEDYLRFQAEQLSVDDFCSDWDLTYDELEKSVCRPLHDRYVKARQAWFARQAVIETQAFSLEGDDPTGHVSSSFNTTPMILRPKAMDRIIRRHLDRRFTPEERTQGFTSIVDSQASWDGTHEDVIFIKKSRMPRLMTLQTPLRRLAGDVIPGNEVSLQPWYDLV